MLIPKDCAKSQTYIHVHMHIHSHRYARTKWYLDKPLKYMQRDTLKTTTDKSKWNPKNVQVTHRRQEKENREMKKKKVQTEKKNKMADLCANISIIILSGHDLPPQLKVGDWEGKKHDPTICWLQETHFEYDKDTLKWKDRKRCVMQSLIRS